MKFLQKNHYLLTILAAVFLISYFTPALQSFFQHGAESIYLSLAIILLTGYLLNFYAPRTSFPSFVWAILFGMAMQPLLSNLVNEPGMLVIIIELLASLVLFGGGIEVPYASFKKYLGPIAALSIFATLATIYLFSLSLEVISPFFGLALPAMSFLVLAAILSSIDPTAIIPSLKNINLKKPFLRDLAVSESAVNDVVGTILTRYIIVAALAAAVGTTVTSGFLGLANRTILDSLALEVIWGTIVGVIGAWMLRKWLQNLELKTNHRHRDPALFFAVPIFCFAAGSIVGGSGFLAAFVAGLLFDGTKPTREVREFFESFGDGFIKPVVFVLLGALAPITVMFDYWLLGILAALIFMFIIRPLVVFISLYPWSRGEHDMFSWRELGFISFVRETGAIPAVLLLALLTTGIAGVEVLFALGMWVILLTLMIEPPLTPWVAKKLDLVKK